MLQDDSGGGLLNFTTSNVGVPSPTSSVDSQKMMNDEVGPFFTQYTKCKIIIKLVYIPIMLSIRFKIIHVAAL